MGILEGVGIVRNFFVLLGLGDEILVEVIGIGRLINLVGG